MADKTTKLSIVIATVDKATAKIKAINDRLDAVSKPTRDFKKALGELREKSGLDDVIGGFKGVGAAIGDLLSKVAMVGGVVGVAVAGLLHLVNEFDDLGDKAERIGVSVDFLAAMRYAAEKAGAPVEALDAGLEGFSASLGQARAGTGRMAAFLGKVSPALLKQLKAAKSNEEAFDLLAGAMAKIEDPAKRAALAQKTLGDAALGPLLAKGPKGIKELRDRYIELAGSQEDAASEAGKVDDSMKDLKASTDGIKAAIVKGLAPALKIIVDRLSEWFSKHRGDVEEWAKQVGERLPGAIEKVVTWIGKAYDKVRSFLDQIGGIKTVLIALAAVTLAPVITSVVMLVASIVQLGTAMSAMAAAGTLSGASMAIALGEVLVVVGAIAAGIYAATKAYEYLNASTGERSGSAADLLNEGKLDATDSVTTDGAGEGYDGIDSVTHQAPIRPPQDLRGAASAAVGAGKPDTHAKVTVDFANAPRGTRVRTDPQSTANIDLSLGFQLAGAQL